MESLKSLDVSSVKGPCLATIKQHRNTDSLVDSHLGGDGKIVIEEHLMQQSAEGRRSSLNTMLNFTVQAAVITQYIPQLRKLPCLNKLIAMHRKGSTRVMRVTIGSKGQYFGLLSIDIKSSTVVSR